EWRHSAIHGLAGAVPAGTPAPPALPSSRARRRAASCRCPEPPRSAATHMTDTAVIEIMVQMMLVVAKVAAPILLVSLAIGLAISLFQSVTQIQEVTLTFVPKLAGVALVIVVSGHWMLGQLILFTHQLFDMIPRLINS